MKRLVKKISFILELIIKKIKTKRPSIWDL